MPAPPSLDDLVLFVEVARAGSFSQASLRLGIPSATMSRRIAGLEKQLGVKLFVRSTRQVRLSDHAQSFFERCAEVVDAAQLAHEALVQSHEQVEGRVRLSVPVDFGLDYLGPLLPEFAALYPHIQLDLELSARHINLLTEHVDMAVRIGPIQGDNLVARPLGHIRMGLFASRDYLSRHGVPLSPADLTKHQCLATGPDRAQARWALTRAGKTHHHEVQGVFCANHIGLSRRLAAQDQGIAMLPLRHTRAALEGHWLAPVLPDWHGPTLPVSLLRTGRQQPLAVRLLTDHLIQRLPPLLEGADSP
ncbi:MAG: LysR family transcriptional regulator [Ideonella sp.]|nr:LysR family transcriptional regulator [Ideonella sp.]